MKNLKGSALLPAILLLFILMMFSGMFYSLSQGKKQDEAYRQKQAQWQKERQEKQFLALSHLIQKYEDDLNGLPAIPFSVSSRIMILNAEPKVLWSRLNHENGLSIIRINVFGATKIVLEAKILLKDWKLTGQAETDRNNAKVLLSRQLTDTEVADVEKEYLLRQAVYIARLEALVSK